MGQSIKENLPKPSGIRGFITSAWAILPILIFAGAILAVGVGRDYRLKHEANNALHATFGRAHVKAGVAVTKGHDAWVHRENHKVRFYAHHPPGCGLVLGGVFSVVESDSPEVVRSVAIVATLSTLLILWWIVRREEGPETALIVALAFAVLPQAAFYGRMVNHEVLSLPFIVLLVERYFSLARGGGWWAGTGLVLVASIGALFAWVTFFAVTACAVHATLSLRRRETFPAAGRALSLALILGALLFALDIAHIAWVKGGDLSDLASILSRRLGAGQSYGPFEWARKMLGFSQRLATISGTIALMWLGIRTIRALLRKTSLKSIEEFAGIFLGAGVGYLVVFNWGAWQHHYWQFPLLPAVVIALSLAIVSVATGAREGPHRMAHGLLLGFIILEVCTASTAALYRFHTTSEYRVINAVEKMKSRFL